MIPIFGTWSFRKAQTRKGRTDRYEVLTTSPAGTRIVRFQARHAAEAFAAAERAKGRRALSRPLEV